MANYVYPLNTITFGQRDELPPGDDNKIISGSSLDTEFAGITNGKLDLDGENFEGKIVNVSAVVDGGTF